MGQSIDQLMGQVKQEAADKLREVLSVSYPPASDPGEPPHLRSGDLLNGYRVDATVDGDVLTVTLTPGVEYADFLEYGTDRMEARPHRQAVIDYLAATLTDRVQEALTMDVLATLEPQGPAAPTPPAGFFGRVRNFFGF